MSTDMTLEGRVIERREEHPWNASRWTTTGPSEITICGHTLQSAFPTFIPRLQSHSHLFAGNNRQRGRNHSSESLTHAWKRKRESSTPAWELTSQFDQGNRRLDVLQAMTAPSPITSPGDRYFRVNCFLLNPSANHLTNHELKQIVRQRQQRGGHFLLFSKGRFAAAPQKNRHRSTFFRHAEAHARGRKAARDLPDDVCRCQRS